MCFTPESINQSQCQSLSNLLLPPTPRPAVSLMDGRDLPTLPSVRFVTMLDFLQLSTPTTSSRAASVPMGWSFAPHSSINPAESANKKDTRRPTALNTALVLLVWKNILATLSANANANTNTTIVVTTHSIVSVKTLSATSVKSNCVMTPIIANKTVTQNPGFRLP